jgi:ankyrin repeat protein
VWNVGKGLPTYFLLLTLIAPAHAFDPERDAWLLPAAKAEVPRAVDPLEFARIRATGNDQEPEYAGADQLALIQAAERGDRAHVEKLLQQGVNPNGLTGPRGNTALVHAVALGDVEIVRVLLDAGADPDLKGGGYTPLGFAALHGHARIASLLLKAGANPNFKSSDGNTPLTAAAGMNRVAVIRVLMRVHPDYTLFNSEGRTALSLAALENFEEAVHAMLEAGVDVNVQDQNKGTALDATTESDNKRIQKLLVDYGATTL